MTDLRHTLARLGLSQYYGTFVEEGFETWETVLDITESDLCALNVKIGHRRKLQREIANARGISEQVAPLPIRATSVEGHGSAETDERSNGSNTAVRPVTGSSGKRKYRRHPKPDENAPERAPSAYVIFSNKIREDLKSRNLSFTEIAKRVGEEWQTLSSEGKEPYESQAAAAKERYNAEMVHYKKTFTFREYTQYLADFKAKNAACSTDGKRPKLEDKDGKESSASTGSRHGSIDTGTNGIVVGRSPVDSTSPRGTPQMLEDRPSPSSTATSPYGASSNLFGFDGPASPQNYLVRRGSNPRSSAQALSSRYIATKGPFDRVPEPPYRHQLPRIIPLEAGEPRPIAGNLPTIMPDPTLLQGHSSPHMNARRSNKAPAPYLHSETSLSSDNSNTTGSSVHTPVTPIEEGRLQRSFLPQPVHPVVSMQPTAFVAAPSMYGHHSSSSSIESPHGRQKFKDLSLIGVKSDPLQNLRNRSSEAREYQQEQYQHQQSQQRLRDLPGGSIREEREIMSRDDDVLCSYQDPPTDPLSVLAYAGRIVDRTPYKPP